MSRELHDIQVPLQVLSKKKTKIQDFRLIVSANGRRRDIKLLLRLSTPVRKSLIEQVTTMDVRTCVIFPFSTTNTLFGQICFKKIKIVSLS